MIEEDHLVAERIVLRRESAFFNNHQHDEIYQGILTTGTVTALIHRYPRIIEGLQTVYDQLKPDTSSSPEEAENGKSGFISWYLDTLTRRGQLMSDETIDRIAKDVASGKYSRQVKLWEDAVEGARKQKSSGETGPGFTMLSLGSFFGARSEYRKGNSREDITHNKRRILTHWLALQTHLQTTYGSVDYKNALLTELILGAPFLEAVIAITNPDDEARRRHQAYLDESIGFVNRFNPSESVRVFEDYTKDYEAPWAEEEKPSEMTPFDRSYLLKVYEFAEAMHSGNWNVEELYALLRQTVLIRGSIFNAKFMGNRVHIVPIDLVVKSLDDIGGYRDQKSFYSLLLEKTEKSDSVMDRLNIILAIGRPGLGKSLGVDAFLSSLPSNARGIKIKYARSLTDKGHMPEYSALVRLAKLHPNLQLFAILEDIDAIAGDRLESPMTSQFLEIDSAAEEEPLPNLHFIATTNRPDVIDPAVIRPGRTTKILVYEEPKEVDDRKEIAQIHARQHKVALSEDTISRIAEKSDGLTPDEIGSIVYSLRFADNARPTEEDIDKIIKEIKLRQKLEVTVKKPSSRGRKN